MRAYALDARMLGCHGESASDVRVVLRPPPTGREDEVIVTRPTAAHPYLAAQQRFQPRRELRRAYRLRRLHLHHAVTRHVQWTTEVDQVATVVDVAPPKCKHLANACPGVARSSDESRVAWRRLRCRAYEGVD